MKRAWHQHFKRAHKTARTDKDGTTFHSKAEMLRWHKLKLWQLAGHVRNLRRQVKFPLETPGGSVRVLTEKGKVATYTADFCYQQKVPHYGTLPDDPVVRNALGGGWEEVIEDFKGYRNREAMFRIAVFEALYHLKVKISR